MEAQEAVGSWSRELIDAVLNVGGSYYLPYQLHATEEQYVRTRTRGSFSRSSSARSGEQVPESARRQVLAAARDGDAT
jgi:hypothetical protein